MAPKETPKKRRAAPETHKPEKRVRVSRPRAPVEESARTAATQDKTQVSDNDESAPENDQTAALLKGFESSDESEDDSAAITTEITIASLPTLPASIGLQKKLSSAAKETDEPGVIYLGRIPHGFFEPQMQAYFSQFGHITRLRLSRNRRTGASKHFAFIEFASAEVASIVAEAMNNYLMFGHLLKVRVIPNEDVRDDLFKGAGKKFRPVPWNRLEREKIENDDREGWAKRVKKEQDRRRKKLSKLKSIGYEFDMPKLKNASSVPVKAIDAVPEVKAVEAAPEVKAIEPTEAAE